MKDYIESLIKNLINQSGSDIHISVGRKPAFRINGNLIFLTNENNLTDENIKEILTVLLGKEIFEKFLIEKEVDFSYTSTEGARLRGNAFFQRGSISIVLRLIPGIKEISELNLPQTIETFARKKQGFFLVVGPVGHGKSTTMASMVNLINKERATHIVTIEDPIEFVYEPNKAIIDQREIGLDTKSFETALKSVFREDVNVIMIGEMRSPETMATAVTAAETGHLVISTLHTNNASQTIDRIIDSFPAGQQDQIRVQLAGSLIGVFSQRLIPSTTGGRVPAYELMISNNAISNLIREKRTHEIDVVIETGLEQGMISMNRSLIELVQQGKITMESAQQFSSNPKGLEQLL
ncbi:MAG: PilT/PilU family type 4a pilus ATPase [Patescibacteria group bacterium]|nr:PilT/PilU family type 4a pilus ATPase [Patescibacteria group bacterium]